jgi:hypothetical protein
MNTEFCWENLWEKFTCKTENKVDLKEIGYEDGMWVEVAEDRPWLIIRS